MIRIVVNPKNGVESRVPLSTQQRHYLFRVMRVNNGDIIEVLIPGRGVFQATVEGSETLTLGAQQEAARLPGLQIILGQALLKQDRMSEVIERGTEAGISIFVPLVTERAIVREVSPKRNVRWQTIATEAAEQCRALAVPEVRPLQTLSQFGQDEDPMPKLIMDPEGPSIGEWLSHRPRLSQVKMAVGPEGGWSDAERRLLRGYGFESVSLGPRVYRAENAGAFASVLLHFFDEMRSDS